MAMIEASVKTGAETRQAPLRLMPFIGLFEPFVGSVTPHVRPFIDQNKPSICFEREKGLTLVELIVTVVIAAILLTLAAPNLSSFLQRDRLGAQANELLADLAFARSEAIKRGVPVIVCKSADPTLADPACNTNAPDPWTLGRVIFVDNVTINNDPDPGEVLRIRQALDGSDGNGNALHGDGSAVGTANEIRFTGLGMANPPGGNTQFVLCDRRGPSQALAVAIGLTGRARVTEHGQDWQGNALTAANCP